MLRYRVKPGMTGWAQVNGWRGNTDTEEKLRKRVEFDFAYIKNWSFLRDLKILVMTVPSALFPPKDNV
jgi:putative colanic acid biosynthesis UDP-glucose lipid carrier transferase